MLLSQILKRQEDRQQQSSASQTLFLLEKARSYVKERNKASSKIIAAKITPELRADIEAVQKEHGLENYTDAVHFCLVVGAKVLRP